MRIQKGKGRLLQYSTMLLVVGVITFLCLLKGFRDISAQSGQDDEIKPGKNLEVIGIPKIPRSLTNQVSRYMGADGLPLAGWHPEKRELWLKGMSRATWLNRVESPGSNPKMWIYMPEGDVYDIYFQPQGKYFIYNKEANGDEAYQMYLYDIEYRNSSLLSDGRSRNTEFVWSNSGKQVIYSYAPPSSVGVSLCIINPFEPKSNRVLVQTTGNYLKAYDWSPDDQQAVFCEFISNASSKLYLINISVGNKQLLSPQTNEDEYYGSPKFSKDGKGIYVITALESEFRQLAYLDLHTKRFKNLTKEINWDIDEFQVSPDGKTVAFTANEDGVSCLYFLDTATSQIKAVKSPSVGIISDLKWHNNSTDVAFNFKSPRSPNDIYSMNAKSDQLQLWVKSTSGGVDLEQYSIPELIHWKSFDGKTISGFLYRPPSTFTGKRPVIIDIHGGPVMQHRPGYSYDHNFFINELGVIKIYPNIRGSSGYGKTFLDLDNGVKREDAVKDIGALLDWIKSQPDLDAARIIVQGDSYGGYVALSVATAYSNRIKGAISDSGFSNLATMIEGTGGWRRSLQRAEFGDERDPKIKAFMEKIAPVNNTQKIKSPLLIIQGKNDPRSPVRESEAFISATKHTGLPVWYLLANDEGHGFVKLVNYQFRMCSIILFVKEYLLK